MNIIDLTGGDFLSKEFEYDSIMKMDRALIDEDFLFESLYEQLSETKGSDHSFLCDYRNVKYKYANQVPVFLVTKDMCGEEFDLDFLGHWMHFIVPEDTLPAINLEGDATTILEAEQNHKESSEINEEKLAENDLKRQDDQETDYPGDVIFEPDMVVSATKEKLILNVWGLYVGPNYKRVFSSVHPMIFIWVDKIYSYVQKNWRLWKQEAWGYREHHDEKYFFNLITCQVILHEMMHALMDIKILETSNSTGIIVPEWYRIIKEESLAEAGSLAMMNGVWTKDDIEFLKYQMSRKDRPFQYRFGAYFFDADDNSCSLVDDAIDNWLDRYYEKRIAEDWLRYIKHSLDKLDRDQLQLYENAFFNPNLSYMFMLSPDMKDQIIYRIDCLVKMVIRYYAAKNNTTKSELIAAFPNNLNEDYDVFIDPLIQNHFVGKKDSNSTSPIHTNYEVECKDGKLYICADWSTDSMYLFVKHARDLGFKIEDF